MYKSDIRCQTSNVCRGGFTLIELLIVISLAVFLGIAGTTNYLGLRNKKALDSNLQRIVEDIRSASANALALTNDKAWGIRFTNSASFQKYEVWFGDSFETGTRAKIYNLSSGISFSDPLSGQCKDVLFERGTGLPKIITGGTCASVTNTVTITDSSTGPKTITINSNGKLDY